MNAILLTWVLLLILTIVLFSFLGWKKNRPSSVLGNYNNGYSCSTSSYDTLKHYLQLRIDYLNSRRDIFTGVNGNVLNKLSNILNSPTFNYDNIPYWLQLLPGGKLGFYPVLPISNPSPVFQFEQGRSGWYWLYGTFPSSKSTFLMQITRQELLPSSVRHKNKIPLGASTIYQFTLGLGINGVNYYTASTFSGNYDILSESSFQITSQTGSVATVFFSIIGGVFTFTATTPMNLVNDPLAPPVNVTFSFNGINSKPLYPDMKNGCAPCLFGDGTDYFSYTQIHMSASATIQSIVYQMTNGIGWMDHQWGGSENTSTLGLMLSNILNKGVVYSAFPKYLWLNLHVNENLQYMIYAFPTVDVKVGTIINAFYTKYTANQLSFLQKCTVTVLSTTLYPPTANNTFNITPINFPNGYQVNIDGNTYIMDGIPYGTAIFPDVSNSLHWGGSTDLYIINNNVKQLIGTGFIESQK